MRVIFMLTILLCYIRDYVQAIPQNLERIKWVKIEGEHITYNFQDTTGMGLRVHLYIVAHEEAYNRIKEILHAELPMKMVFYVWNDDNLVKQILGRELGFTDPLHCTSYVRFNQTVGHEMTHTLSYWGWGIATEPDKRTRFINEGIAVAFDQTRRDKFEMAKQAVAGKNIHSILDIWKDDGADASLVYPVGGAFMMFLFQKSTPEQFKSIVKDQGIENGRKIYGTQQFDAMIKEFDRSIGIE